MTDSVQLPVQLPCSYVQLPCSPLPCLPLGELHACTRAARSPIGIGSSWPSFDFRAIDNSNLAVACCCASARHRDQQSLSLLADGAICIVLVQLFAIAWLINRHWECHGKIAGERLDERSLQSQEWARPPSEIEAGQGKSRSFGHFDEQSPYAAENPRVCVLPPFSAGGR
jgi:hypothetical protein